MIPFRPPQPGVVCRPGCGIGPPPAQVLETSPVPVLPPFEGASPLAPGSPGIELAPRPLDGDRAASEATRDLTPSVDGLAARSTATEGSEVWPTRSAAAAAWAAAEQETPSPAAASHRRCQPLKRLLLRAAPLLRCVIESLLLIAGIHPNPGPIRTRKSSLGKALGGRMQQIRPVLQRFSEVLSKSRLRADLILNCLLHAGLLDFLARRLNAGEDWLIPLVQRDHAGVSTLPQDPEPPVDTEEEGDRRVGHLDLLEEQMFFVHLLEAATLINPAAGNAVLPSGLHAKYKYVRHKLDEFALGIGAGAPGGACFGLGSPLALYQWSDAAVAHDGIQLPTRRSDWAIVLRFAANQMIGQLKNILHWKR